MGSHRLPRDLIESIVKRWAAGATYSEIAAEFSMTRNAVGGVIQRYTPPKPGTKVRRRGTYISEAREMAKAPIEALPPRSRVAKPYTRRPLTAIEQKIIDLRAANTSNPTIRVQLGLSRSELKHILGTLIRNGLVVPDTMTIIQRNAIAAKARAAEEKLHAKAIASRSGARVIQQNQQELWSKERDDVARFLRTKKRWMISSIAKHLTLKTDGPPVAENDVVARLYGTLAA